MGRQPAALLERPRVASDRRPLFITPDQAARALLVNRGTIYRMIKRGELPASRTGNRIKIPVQELRDLYPTIPDDYNFGEP